MATKLYLRDTETQSADGPSAEQSTSQPNGSVSSPAFAKRDLIQDTPGASMVTLTHTHPNEADVHRDGMIRMFVSADLNGTDITAETWTFAIAGNESNAAANAYTNIVLYVWRPGTGSKVGTIIDAHQGTGGPFAEINSPLEQIATIAGAAVSGVDAGDVLVLEVWHHWQHSMAVAYTSTLYYDGTTDITQGGSQASKATYISTPQNGIFGAAGTNYTTTATDTVSLADATSRLMTWSRTAPDTLTVSDQTSRDVVYERTVPDTLGLSDGQARTVEYTRDVPDTVSLDDLANPVLTPGGEGTEYEQSVDDAVFAVDLAGPVLVPEGGVTHLPRLLQVRL